MDQGDIDFNQSVANPSTLVVHQTSGAASVDSGAFATRKASRSKGTRAFWGC
jgi:hypothetical protein